MKLSNPSVVYPFVDIPERNVSLSSLELTVFVASLAFSRFHFTNAEILATEPWRDYFASDPVISRLATKITLISPEELAPFSKHREIFWSTIAKMIACSRHCATDDPEMPPLLLMDADAIVFDPRPAIDWRNPYLFFAAGYKESPFWEPYVEGAVRLHDCLQAAVGRQFSPSEVQTYYPINAGCLYFGNATLLRQYAKGLRTFMETFISRNMQARLYFKDRAQPQFGGALFSEVMVADQLLLSMLIDRFFAQLSPEDERRSRIKFFIEESSFQHNLAEFPPYSSEFLHLWKLKGWLQNRPSAEALVEQAVLRRLHILKTEQPTFMHGLLEVASMDLPIVGSRWYYL